MARAATVATASATGLARPLSTHTCPAAGVGVLIGSVQQPAARFDMEAFLISTGLVALAEIGDKTQLLAFMLAARFRRPWTICLGILIATLANHAGAGALGAWAATQIG